MGWGRIIDWSIALSLFSSLPSFVSPPPPFSLCRILSKLAQISSDKRTEAVEILSMFKVPRR